jgi:hypothetical protein
MKEHPDMYWDLLPLEKKFMENWPYKPSESDPPKTQSGPAALGGGTSRSAVDPDTAVKKQSASEGVLSRKGSTKEKRPSSIIDSAKGLFGSIVKRGGSNQAQAVKEGLPAGSVK